MANKGRGESVTFLKDHVTTESPVGSMDATIPLLHSSFLCPPPPTNYASLLSREQVPKIFVKNGHLSTFLGRWPDTKNATFIATR